MFAKQLKAMNEVNVEFNIVMRWFRVNVDPDMKLLGEFLKLNDVFPIGEARDQAYIELMEKKIEEAGLTEKFKSETKSLISNTKLLLADHTRLVESVAKYHNTVAEYYEKIIDEATFKEFVKVFDDTNQIVL